jgi:excisionase family DNA binding protein
MARPSAATVRARATVNDDPVPTYTTRKKFGVAFLALRTLNEATANPCVWPGTPHARSLSVDPTGGIMTVSEVAAYLKVHPMTVYRLVRSNVLPCFRVGSELRFSKADIDEWIREREKPIAEKP